MKKTTIKDKEGDGHISDQIVGIILVEKRVEQKSKVSKSPSLRLSCPLNKVDAVFIHLVFTFTNWNATSKLDPLLQAGILIQRLSVFTHAVKYSGGRGNP